MKQQQLLKDTSQQKTPTTDPDYTDELRERQLQHEQETAQRATEQTARDELQVNIENDLGELDERIEELLSANPQEFVIRFLQTEGQ